MHLKFRKYQTESRKICPGLRVIVITALDISEKKVIEEKENTTKKLAKNKKKTNQITE